MFRFLRNQTPLTIFVEVLFALLLFMIFFASQGRGFNLAALRRNEDMPAAQPSPAPTALPSPVVAATATATNAPTVSTAQPAQATADPLRGLACRDLVLNGDFEALDGWQMPVTARPASLTNEQIYSGSSSLKLGLTDADQPVAGESIAAQTVDLPIDATLVYLHVQLWPGSDGDAADSQYLLIENDGLSQIAFEQRTDARTWVPFSYDLTPLRGQSVRLLFGVNNNGDDDRAVLYVDDLRVLSCTPE